MLVLSKIGQLFGRTYERLKTRFSLDLENKNHSVEEIKKFKRSFFRFHFLIVLICLSTVLVYWLSLPEIPLPSTCEKGLNLKNLYDEHLLFDLHAYLSENETTFDSESQLIWRKQRLAYGDAQTVLAFNTKISISKVGVN